MDHDLFLYRLRRLEIKPHDVLLLKADLSASDFERFAVSCREKLLRVGLSDILIIQVPSDCDLEVLDEGRMRDHGWVRAPLVNP